MLCVQVLSDFRYSVPCKGKVEYLPYHMGNLIVNEQMVVVGGVFHIPVRGVSSHIFPLIEPRTVRRFYLDRHIR